MLNADADDDIATLIYLGKLNYNSSYAAVKSVVGLVLLNQCLTKVSLTLQLVFDTYFPDQVMTFVQNLRS